MNISKLALIALLGSALAALGCSSDDNGTGGSGGTGGTAGSGGIGPIVECAPQAAACMDSEVEEVVACCVLESPPDDADACTGDESLENPTECTATGTVVTHRMTMLALARGCSLGEDTDTCNGDTCAAGGLAPGDGEGGVDNGVYALNATLTAGELGNVGGVDQAFSDAFCGLTDGDEDEAMCNDPQEVDVLAITLDVDANVEEGCANVKLTSAGGSADVILNLGAVTAAGTVCASGTVGTIPIAIAGETGAITNATVRMTVSEQGFSNGLMSAVIDGETAIAITNILAPGAGALVGALFDIALDGTKDVSLDCNALSSTFEIGGVAVGGTGGAGGAGTN